MTDDAQRSRTAVVTLTSIVLAAATLYASGGPRLLALSFEANADHWVDLCGCDHERPYREPMSCFGRPDDDACYREMFRAQIEALEANRSYDEMSELSPTGVAFAKPTVVRRPLARGNARYAPVSSTPAAARSAHLYAW